MLWFGVQISSWDGLLRLSSMKMGLAIFEEWVRWDFWLDASIWGFDLGHLEARFDWFRDLDFGLMLRSGLSRGSI